MADMLDKVHDLVHHAYDTVSGALKAPSTPSKSPSTTKYFTPPGQAKVGTGIAAAGQDSLSGRQEQVNKAVDDAS